MQDKINVIYIEKRTDYNKLIELYNDPKINETFDGYRTDRLLATEISFLITLNNHPIGFILLVREKERKDSLAIDMAIKEEYRGKGYGKIAMEKFRDEFLLLIGDNLHAEVKKDNLPANRLVNILDNECMESADDSEIYHIVK